MPRRALFLDRDGVINVDHSYVYHQEDFEFIDGVFELCSKAKHLGYLIVVVTNQAGIGRGYYKEQDFQKLTEWMLDIFASKGIIIDDVYYCPYHPEHGIGKYKKDAACRKPQPGMILQAARDYNIELGNSILVGDKESDILAGIAAGIGCNLLYVKSSEKSMNAKEAGETVIITKLTDVVKYLNEDSVPPKK